jgi:hypothetical protein
MLDHAILEFHRQIQRESVLYVESHNRIRLEMPKIKAERRKLEIEARNLSGAIAQYGTHRSLTLLSKLTFVESRIETIDRIFRRYNLNCRMVACCKTNSLIRSSGTVEGTLDLFSGLSEVMQLVAPRDSPALQIKTILTFSTAFPKAFPTKEISIQTSIVERCCPQLMTSKHERKTKQAVTVACGYIGSTVKLKYEDQ